MNKTIPIVILIIIIVGVGIWGALRLRKNDETKTADQSQSQPEAPKEQTPPADTAQTNLGCTRNVNTQAMQDKIDITNKFVTLTVRGYGDIKVQLYDKDAPKTVENFLRLTHSGYYDCLTFHRIAQNFVIQGGDPTGTGSGGESAFGGEFADELNPNTPSGKAGYQKGVLAMANRGPNTNTSQFFIMLDNVDLPYNYTIFGKVVAGQDIVDKIGKVEIIPQLGPTDGAPKDKIVIEKAVISDK